MANPSVYHRPMGEETPSRSRAPAWYICAAVLLASLPAWTGSWIYDDWAMAQTPLMQSWQDAARVFFRTSIDYLGQPNTTTVVGVTYRPLAMASLIAVHATVATPLAHHVFSLLVHLATTLLLGRALRVTCSVGVATVLTMTFALHPLAIEAYGWINGRADLMAGFGLVLLACGLAREQGRRSQALAFVGIAIGGLSKETGVVAALLLCAAYALPDRGPPTWHEMATRRLTLLAACAGFAAALIPRAIFAALPSSGPSGFIADLDEPRLLFRLLALSVENLVVPTPRTMLNLAWALDQPASVAGTLLAIVAIAGWVWTVVAQRFRASLLLAGAFLVILPCLTVRHGFWHGFDRYLYMPTIMIALGLGPLVPRHPLATLRVPAARILTAGWSLLLFMSSWATASSYASQSAFVEAMIEMRPTDPTGYLIAASERVNAHDLPAAKAMLEKVDTARLPPPLALHQIAVLRASGREADELRLVTELDARDIDSPVALHGLVSVWLYHRDLTRAFKTAARLGDHPALFCDAIVTLVRGHVRRGTYTKDERALALRFLERPTCRAGTPSNEP